MIVKAEQDRIRALLRDTITLLCKNGLSFKSEFSIEALIGITLDKDDVVLVSINEQVKPEHTSYPDEEISSDESVDWSRSEDTYPESHSINRSGGDRNHHRRRRRKRPYIKPKQEQYGDDNNDQGLLDLSTDHQNTSRTERAPAKRRASEFSAGIDNNSQQEDSKESVIVKKEFVDENWPPEGVMQEVTVGGSDSGNSDQAAYPSFSTPSSVVSTSSSVMQHMSFNPAAVMASPSSSPRHPHMPPLPALMNGLPFPPLPLPQSHFAQALGRLVGSVPPGHAQKMDQSASKDITTPSKLDSSTISPALYQPTSRSSLPKVAVALMTEWLRKNTHNPYPTDDVKDEFVQMTGLTFNQINYWFTNARRRLLPKWEMQRNLREQEMVQQLSHQQMVSTPTSASTAQVKTESSFNSGET